MEKLKVLPTAVGMGATWGVGVMLLAWISATGWGGRIVDLLSSVYLGLRPTFAGGIIGGLWAFADAFVAGVLFTLVFNAVNGRGARFPSLSGREPERVSAAARSSPA